MAENNTKEKLLKAGIHLFAEHGYESTSTRMIAETTGTNIATMAFHFGNKENFYVAVLNYVAEIMRSDLQEFREQVKEAHKNRTPSPDEAWKLIELYVDQLLSILKNTNTNNAYGNKDMLNLLFREQITPVNNQYPITSVLCKESEAVLNLLLSDYWQSYDKKETIIVSRIVTGAIISFGEHPIFIRRALGYPDDAVLDNDVWDTLRSYILNSIRGYTPG